MGEGRCVFVLFMIFNSIMGLTGLILLGFGIYAAVTTKLAGVNSIYIALIIIGAYITLLLILGACSWQKQGVLIAYFILALLLLIVELVMIILSSVGKQIVMNEQTKISIIIYGVSLGISFFSFLFSTIYFCRMRSDDQNLYINVKNMESGNYRNL